MIGHHVTRRFGWDCHGLPIEFVIDKKLGIKTREQVIQMGIDNYNEECMSIVTRYVAEWESTVTRMGQWIDFKDNYKMMDINFIESVWWALSQLFDKGLVNRGFKIADAVGAFLMMDMAHISGLVAASMVANSFEYCDVVTTSTYKGGPHNHTIGGLAVCLKHAQSPKFNAYQGQIISNCRALASRLKKLGYKLVSGGSDNHLVLVDLRPLGLDGARRENSGQELGGRSRVPSITLNKNSVSAWPQGADQRINATVDESRGLGLGVKSWGWSWEEVVKANDIGNKIIELMVDERFKIQAVHVKEESKKADKNARISKTESWIKL
ncbi:hypothetical protein GIB67_015814 [Kingdonia uniflora]|uniref:Glycine hydroxymethyltransferase n=1 Tax=Kingdonia uniflora TaxID=39325 RepID=A0A7J7NV49_9MAGN|nr:hypothetical protein GIB67_015814 [Kingdonia uniflora]